MSKIRDSRKPLLCAKKKRYRSAREANNVIDGLSRFSVRDNVPSRCYYCDLCNFWHLTSRERRYE